MGAWIEMIDYYVDSNETLRRTPRWVRGLKL